MSRVAFATSLFDHDGIQIRFMNNRLEGNNIASEQAAANLLQQVKFSGLTPLGTSMWSKVIQPLVLGPARSNALQKPVLIISECFWWFGSVLFEGPGASWLLRQPNIGGRCDGPVIFSVAGRGVKWC